MLEKHGHGAENFTNSECNRALATLLSAAACYLALLQIWGGGGQAFSSLVLYVHTYINLHCIPKVSESITFTVTGSCLCVRWRTRTVTAAVTRTIGVRLRHILAWIGHKVVHWISARTLHTCRTMVSIFEYGAARTK